MPMRARFDLLGRMVFEGRNDNLSESCIHRMHEEYA